ncbi:MAG: hypothetical protein AB1461_18080 [Thermodesulfobacteriota bacterium]
MSRFQDKASPDWPGWLVLLFLTNLFVKILPLFQGIMIHPDAPVYLWAAQALEQGNIPAAIKAYPMLFYPFLVMCVHKLGVDWLAAGRTISVAASCLALLPFIGLAKRFSPGWPAIIISMVFILLPEYDSIAFEALRDPLYICLALFSVYSAVRFAESQEWQWFLAVILFAISLPFLRVEGLVVSLVILGWSIVGFIRSFDRRGRMWALAVTACLVAFLFSVFCLSETARDLLRLGRVTAILGKFGDTPRSMVYYLDKLDELARNNVPSGFGNNFWQVIERHWQWVYGIGMVFMFENNLSWLLILLGIVGVKEVVRVPRTGLLLVAVFMANMSLIFAKYLYSGSIEGRVMLLPAILWLLLAGAAFSFVAGYLAEKCRIGIVQKKANVLILLGLLLALPFAYKTASMDYNIDIPVLRDSCRWVNGQLLSDGKDWQVWVNMRTMVWFLEKQDARQIGPKNKQKVFRILKQSKKKAVVILLLSRRNENDIALMKKLVETKKFSSKLFTDPNDEKNFVIVVWREKKR